MTDSLSSVDTVKPLLGQYVVSTSNALKPQTGQYSSVTCSTVYVSLSLVLRIPPREGMKWRRQRTHVRAGTVRPRSGAGSPTETSRHSPFEDAPPANPTAGRR